MSSENLLILNLNWQHENVNVSDALKRSPLHIAASEGQVRIILDFAINVCC